MEFSIRKSQEDNYRLVARYDLNGKTYELKERLDQAGTYCLRGPFNREERITAADDMTAIQEAEAMFEEKPRRIASFSRRSQLEEGGEDVYTQEEEGEKGLGQAVKELERPESMTELTEMTEAERERKRRQKRLELIKKRHQQMHPKEEPVGLPGFVPSGKPNLKDAPPVKSMSELQSELQAYAEPWSYEFDPEVEEVALTPQQQAIDKKVYELEKKNLELEIALHNILYDERGGGRKLSPEETVKMDKVNEEIIKVEEEIDNLTGKKYVDEEASVEIPRSMKAVREMGEEQLKLVLENLDPEKLEAVKQQLGVTGEEMTTEQMVDVALVTLFGRTERKQDVRTERKEEGTGGSEYDQSIFNLGLEDMALLAQSDMDPEQAKALDMEADDEELSAAKERLRTLMSKVYQASEEYGSGKVSNEQLEEDRERMKSMNYSTALWVMKYIQSKLKKFFDAKRREKERSGLSWENKVGSRTAALGGIEERNFDSQEEVGQVDCQMCGKVFAMGDKIFIVDAPGIPSGQVEYCDKCIQTYMNKNK